MHKTSTQKLHERLFLQLSLEEGEGSKEGSGSKEKADPELNGKETQLLSKAQPNLVKLLNKIGIEKAEERLCVCAGSFRLSGSEEEHKADCDILLDLAKAADLIEQGFVPLDAFYDGEKYSVVIISSDTVADFDLPSADELYDVTQKESLTPSDEETQKMVEAILKDSIRGL